MDPSVNAKPVKLLKGNTRVHLHDLGQGTVS